jgi:hypothetical protein
MPRISWSLSKAAKWVDDDGGGGGGGGGGASLIWHNSPCRRLPLREGIFFLFLRRGNFEQDDVKNKTVVLTSLNGVWTSEYSQITL